MRLYLAHKHWCASCIALLEVVHIFDDFAYIYILYENGTNNDQPVDTNFTRIENASATFIYRTLRPQF